MSQKARWLSRRREHDDEDDEQHRQHDVDDMPRRQQDRLARHAAVELRKAMIEPVKVIAPIATPIDISTSACAMDLADRADAEGLRRIERRRRDEHRREADQRVEGGDELRHRRHRNSPRDDRAGRAARAHAR